MLRRILNILGYVGLTLLLVVLTVGLVAYGRDYTYDFATRSIIQKGHIIISSIPNGLQVWEGDKKLNKKTPFREAYKVGTHTFTLSKDGYWPWKKTLEAIAGQVNLARYVTLVPRTPAKTVLDTRAQIVAQNISRDHRHLAYISGGTDAALYTLDIGNPKPKKIYTPKAATATEPAEVLKDIVWSEDASHLLIVSSVGDQVVHRLMSSEGGAALNLTADFGFNLTGLKFSASNWRQLYWLSPDGLRRLDVEAKTVSAVLADKVSQFWVIPERVLYVQRTELGRSLWSLDSRGRRQELIQALVESDTYSIAFATYRGDEHLAIVPAKTQTGTLYSDIFGSTPVAKIVARGVTDVSFSPDGHLVAFSSPGSIATYDLERSQIDNKPVIYPITDQPGQLLALSWFDNYHLLTTRDGKLYWSEYDGTNRIELGTAAGSLPGYGTADSRSIVTFRPDNQVVRITELLIKP